MENYKQKYKEIVERIKELHAAGNFLTKKQMEIILAQLAKSEDERIGNVLYCIVRDNKEVKRILEGNGVSVDATLAWLEKQKKQYALQLEDAGCVTTPKSPVYTLNVKKQKESLHTPQMCKENADSFTDEDERIRKEIREYLYNERHNIDQLTPRTNEFDRWLTWLSLKFRIGDVIKFKSRQWTIVGIDFDNHCYDLTNNECVDFDTAHYEFEYSLEKQKEQKPTAEEVLIKAGLKPFKDGNQWCILIGDNIQEGICGFGDTIEDALYHFLRETMAYQKEQKPVDVRFPNYNNIVDKVFGAGNLESWERDEAEALVRLAKEELLKDMQKPAEWSEEDEKMCYYVTEAVQIRYSDRELAKYYNSKVFIEKKKLKEEIFNWLNSLKDRIKGR